jgi:hypothetical protein
LWSSYPAFSNLLIANQAPNIKICIIVVLLATSDQNNPSLSTARVPLGKNQGKIQKCILGLLVARRNNYRPRKRVCKWFYQAWSGRSAGF